MSKIFIGRVWTGDEMSFTGRVDSTVLYRCYLPSLTDELNLQRDDEDLFRGLQNLAGLSFSQTIFYLKDH